MVVQVKEFPFQSQKNMLTLTCGRAYISRLMDQPWDSLSYLVIRNNSFVRLRGSRCEFTLAVGLQLLSTGLLNGPFDPRLMYRRKWRGVRKKSGRKTKRHASSFQSQHAASQSAVPLVLRNIESDI